VDITDIHGGIEFFCIIIEKEGFEGKALVGVNIHECAKSKREREMNLFVVPTGIYEL
jgi:hypothetical protein